MSKPEIKNLSASIRDRLLNQARLNGRPFNELLQYYAIERFLYRLAQSRQADRFILKGALLFRMWGLQAFRPTRDIDLLGRTSNEVEDLIDIIREVCTQPVQEDGLLFDEGTVAGMRITEDAEYEGVRVRFTGFLGKARIHLQVDIGFADVVFPGPAVMKYPVILPMPAPRMSSYPPETVVAEKLQAMIYLGTANSRMKDFYDLWALASRFKFKGNSLLEAVRRTFVNRNTDIPAGEPAAFSSQFARNKQGQWRAFLKTGNITGAPAEMEPVLALLQDFTLPIFSALLSERKFNKKWNTAGIWK